MHENYKTDKNIDAVLICYSNLIMLLLFDMHKAAQNKSDAIQTLKQ